MKFEVGDLVIPTKYHFFGELYKMGIVTALHDDETCPYAAVYWIYLEATALVKTTVLIRINPRAEKMNR